MLCKYSVIIITTLPLFVFAGSIVTGECENCGYNTDTLFIGGGKIPALLYYIYASSELKKVFTVGFDLIKIIINELGMKIIFKDAYDRADFIINNSKEYSEFLLKWEPPEMIVTDKMPYGSNIGELNIEDLSKEMYMLTLIENPCDGEFKLCPSCGEYKLKFKIEGKWD